jgi:hypothetical protein
MQHITQTQITNMQMNLNLSATMTKALVGMVKEYVTEVTTELSKIYGFPLEEALKRLDLENLQPNEKKQVKSEKKQEKSEKKQEKSEKKQEKKCPTFMLPYCGVTCETWCKAVKLNSGLMTQCTKTPEMDDYCKTCAKTMDATTGKPKFGSMHDRNKEGWTDPSGKSPVRYVTVMSKIKVDGVPVTEEQVKEEVLKMGWTIPETEWMKEDADTKHRGRPKKSKPVTNSGSVGDDMIANLVLQAKLEDDTSSDETGSDSDPAHEDEVPAKPKKVKNEPAKQEADKKEKEAKQEADKKEKEAKQEADKKEKEAKQEADKKEKEAKKEADKKEKEAKQEADKKEKEAKQEADKKEKEAKQEADKKEKEAKKEADKKEKEAKKEADKKEKEAKKEVDKKEKETKKETKKKGPEEEVIAEGIGVANKTRSLSLEHLAAEEDLSGKAKATQEATRIAEDLAMKKANKALESKLALEEGELSEEEEEEVSVTKFTFEGKNYLRDEKNVIYDYESQDELGVWTGTKIELYESLSVE